MPICKTGYNTKICVFQSRKCIVFPWQEALLARLLDSVTPEYENVYVVIAGVMLAH